MSTHNMQNIIAGEEEQGRSREHHCAVTYGASQQQHMSLSIDFRLIVHGTKKKFL